MPSETLMKNTLQRYLDAYNRQDLDAVVALYREDASVEDPYGTPARQGREEILAFYRQAMASGARLSLSAPIRGSHGDAAAMAFDAVLDGPQGRVRVSVIDVMTFDEAGLIRSMRAYFGPGDIQAG